MQRRYSTSPRSLLAAVLCLLVVTFITGFAAVGYALDSDTVPAATPTSYRQLDAPALLGRPATKAEQTTTVVAAAPPAATDARFEKPDIAETMTKTAAQRAEPAPRSGGRRGAAPTRAIAFSEPSVREFRSSVSEIDEPLKYQLKASGVWEYGAPVPMGDLRVVTISHWDFEGQVQTGRLVVNQAWAEKVCTVFEKLFDARFPIRRMDPVDTLGSTGRGAAAWDNSEGYQARRVNGGWSMHASGLAIDINPVENPWVRSGKATVPLLGAAFRDRPLGAEGVIHRDGVVVKAFRAIGWKWGGDWSSSKDYMHFSSNGR